MTGIEILDTYGRVAGCDQLCEALIHGDVRVGDMVTLETESGPVELCVLSLEMHQHCDADSVSTTFGISFFGDSADEILPGDMLSLSREPMLEANEFAELQTPSLVLI